MKRYQREATSTELSNYCHLADEKAFIEITHWHNGEGFDVVINSGKDEKNLSLTWGELQAVNALANYKG